MEKKSQTIHIRIFPNGMEIFEEEKEIQIEMSCADNPFFFFPLMENYQLHYIRFAFSLMP